MAINADWHRAHPMPKSPTIDQSIAWAIEHASACGCREIPPRLRAEMMARGIVPPPRAGGERGGPARPRQQRSGRRR
jgi:hypothetical protein